MSTTEGSRIHIEVSYKENGADITYRYAVTPDILRQARIWSSPQKFPTEALTNSWFITRGAKLDSKDGPARVGTYVTGTRFEEYWHDGKLDRADGPARVTVCTNGTRIEQYFHDGKRNRVDGPAYVETRADGTRIESYYREDKFLKKEILAPLTALPGVKVLKAPPPAP